MRYGVTHKEQSRARILDAAARQFRLQGVDAVRVIDVMELAGLTHGGFYKHFADKVQLLQEAIATALDEVVARIIAMTAGKPRAQALEMVISYYLSEDHVRHPDLGCALAALGSEMARMPARIQREVSKALLAYADRLSYLLPGADQEQRMAAFLVLFPAMAGCIMTARTLTDRKKQSQLLAGARHFFIQTFCQNAFSMEPTSEQRVISK
jgi:TetR/AcrR family transcriptional regulator, transcriptional repressor for nem operon